MDKTEIEAIAKEINEISFDYHLSHATFACERLIQRKYREYSEDKLQELADKLKTAARRKDYKEISRLTEEKNLLYSKSKYRIFIEYVPNMAIEAARVVKTNNQLVINLPKALLDITRNPDGTYIKENVKALRKLMAHELGHIALHIKELLEIDGLNGEKELRNEQAEIEADWFANKLLDLRHERNKYIFKNRIYDAF